MTTPPAPDTEPPRRRGRPPSLDRTAALDAARRAIARRGLDRTRYSDIAEEAGVAVSTLQHTFGRLDQILELALERSQDLDAEFLAALPSRDEASAWERIEAFAVGALAGPVPSPSRIETLPMVDSWLVWVELWRASARDQLTATRTSNAYERWWTAAEAIIADGQADGSFTTSESATDLSIAINALIDGIAVGLLLRGGGGEIEQAQRITLLSTRRLLSP